MDEKTQVRCIADVKAVLGEGPIWVRREQALYWVDIKGFRIFRLDGSSNVSSWETPLRVGSLAPRIEGGFIAGTDRGLALIDPAHGRFDIVADLEPDRPHNRFNDGKVDRAGRFWAGTMDDTEEDESGALYRVDKTLAASRVDDGYKVTNGPAFSRDGGVMYHADSARQVIYAFDLDQNGAASGRRIFARFGEEDGYPDGMTVDAEDCLWVAFWDGWSIRRFSPSGECIQVIDMPVQRPTSLTFGGADLKHLYVTSASIDLDEKALTMQPYAGGLFLLTPGVGGVAELPFAG